MTGLLHDHTRRLSVSLLELPVAISRLTIVLTELQCMWNTVGRLSHTNRSEHDQDSAFDLVRTTRKELCKARIPS